MIEDEFQDIARAWDHDAAIWGPGLAQQGWRDWCLPAVRRLLRTEDILQPLAAAYSDADSIIEALANEICDGV